MPNWVYNRVTVHGGTPEERANFAASVKTDETPLSFQNIIPRPDDIEDWYHFNTANWGTKWDANITDFHSDEDTLDYQFDTAWAPPGPIFAKICADNPNLKFAIVYQEEQGWGGELKGEDGTISVVRQWDVAASHAEHLERGNECWCSDEEAVYPDCFSFRAKELENLESRVKEAAVSLGNGWTGSFDQLIEAAKLL